MVSWDMSANGEGPEIRGVRPGEGRRRRKAIAGVIALCTFVSALAAALLFVRDSPDSIDATIMLEVTENIVEHQDFHPTFRPNFYHITTSNYGLGMSLLFAVPFAVARASDHDPTAAAMATNAFVFALTAVAVLALTRLLDATWPQALMTTLLVAAGTCLLPYVATGFSELAVAATVAFGLAAVAAARRGRWWAGFAGGAAGGAAILIRTESAAIVLPVLAVALLLASPHRRVLVRFAVGATPFLAVWAWYNAVRFGAPWELGYGTDAGFANPLRQGLYGLVLSPGRGLLWYAPLVLVAVAGLRAAWRRDRVVTGAAVALLLMRLLFFASWAEWAGGWAWGPRFLVPVMPTLAVGIVEVVRRWRRSALVPQLLVAGVVLLGMSVQLVGTAVDYVQWNESPAQREVRSFEAYATGWKYFPIAQQAGWIVTGRARYAGWALPPRHRPRLFTALLDTALIAAVAAAGGAYVLGHGGMRPGRGLARRRARSAPGHPAFQT